MCVRYYRRADKQRIADAFRLGQLPEGFVLPPDFNIAPATFQPVIREGRDTGGREAVMMRWGLVPYFAKRRRSSRALAPSMRRRRMSATPCGAVPSSAAWCRPMASTMEAPRSEDKQPYAFAMADHGLFAFAGLWDAWKNPLDRQWLQTFSIVTTERTN